jgi:hypothetical protein
MCTARVGCEDGLSPMTDQLSRPWSVAARRVVCATLRRIRDALIASSSRHTRRPPSVQRPGFTSSGAVGRVSEQTFTARDGTQSLLTDARV